MATKNHTFVLNGKKVSVDVEEDVRMLWVLRDILKVNGPKYGCGLDVCQACTSHINGKAFNPCSVSMKYIKAKDRITTIEGLAKKDGTLHPVQQAWVSHSVSQCGYCQPGQIMAAAALIKRRKGKVREKDLDSLRNICRCGTYPRIREAIKDAAKNM